MEIQWFNKALKDGIASIYSTNITINKVGAINLDNAEYVQVGISLEDRYVIIKPINIKIPYHATSNEPILKAILYESFHNVDGSGINNKFENILYFRM